jgi:teichuronic acid biosynthesis glycosyltransferase TuaC
LVFFKSTPALPVRVAAAPARLRVLVLTKVFPNAAEPWAAAFNRQQFAALARRPDVERVEIVAPVPWFPGAGRFGGRTGAGRLHDVPAFEWIDGLFVRHPRVLHVPRVDYAAAAALGLAALVPQLSRWRGRFDVVLGSFAYPDGVTATWLGRALGIPAVIAVLGSDLNLTARLAGVAPQLRQAFSRAARVVAVSRDLAGKAQELGAPAARVCVVNNGIDRALFHPRDRDAARAALGHPGDRSPWIVYVGRLETSKGIADLLQATAQVAAARSGVKLALVGDGSARPLCEQAARARPGEILLPGARSLDEVATWMAAANLVTLPSHAEGTPNVVLEALASGRPVVATRVGGIPDVITTPELGELVPPHDPAALGAALLRGLDRSAVSASLPAPPSMSWDESAAALRAVLRDALLDPVRR